MDINYITSENARFIRKRKNLSLMQVANETGITKSTLSRLENNSKPITIVELKILSDFYNIPTCVMMSNIDKKTLLEYL